MNYLFTSESVSEGHPDKVADQISDAILDEFLRQDPESKVACETFCTAGLVVVGGEVKSEHAYVDIQETVRKVIRKIGYTKAEYGFDADSCGIISTIHEQSADINRGVEREEPSEQGAGDQGMMFGYACRDTEEYMPLALSLSHAILRILSDIRREENSPMPYLRPDAKAQFTVEFSGKHKPLRVHTIDSYAVCMGLDSAALDTARLTQVIDERYEWYLPDSQYPIIENVTSTTFFNMEPIGTTRYAYCNLPEGEAACYVTPDDEDVTDEQDGFSEESQPISDIIHYEIETQGKIIHMSYDLDEEATITTIVANHMGMVYISRQWTQAAGQGYSMQIDCNGLHSGMYILYINVNGKVYSEKVTL